MTAESGLTEQILKVLASADAKLFLAELTSLVTTAARKAYRDEDQPDLESLKAANEVLHAVSAKAIGLERSTKRFPDSAFLGSIRDRAGRSFGKDLEWALSEAVKTVETKGET